MKKAPKARRMNITLRSRDIRTSLKNEILNRWRDERSPSRWMEMRQARLDRSSLHPPIGLLSSIQNSMQV